MPDRSFNTMNQLETLTQRETQVLVLVSHGLQNKQIAHDLGIAIGTVGQHLKSIYNKLGVSNRTTASMLFARLSEQKYTENAVYTGD